MTDQITLCLVRHGKTAGNVRRGYIGSRTDEDLCAQGIRELEEAVREGRYPEADFLYLSPMKRCLQTAGIIWQPLMEQGRCRIIPGLRECDFGEFDGKSYSELSGVPRYQEWIGTDGMGAFPGGEDPKEFIARSVRAFDMTVSEAFGSGVRTIGYAVHGGTVMSVMSLRAPERKSYYDWHVMNGEGFLVTVCRETWERDRRFEEVRAL